MDHSSIVVLFTNWSVRKSGDYQGSRCFALFWRSKWVNLSAYFRFPEYIRRAIYTTNAVEAVHRQFRKLTKTKSGFPNENSLLKLLYAGILKASERWGTAVQNWSLCLSQLAIHFDGRLDEYLEL